MSNRVNAELQTEPLAAGLFQAATEHFRVVIRGGEERVELERVLSMRTVGQQARSVSVTPGRSRGDVPETTVAREAGFGVVFPKETTLAFS